MFYEPVQDAVTRAAMLSIINKREWVDKLNRGLSLTFGGFDVNREMRPDGDYPFSLQDLRITRHGVTCLSLSEHQDIFPNHTHVSLTLIEAKDGRIALSVRLVSDFGYQLLQHQLNHIKAERVRLASHPEGPIIKMIARAEMMEHVSCASRELLEITLFSFSQLQQQRPEDPTPKKEALTPCVMNSLVNAQRVTEDTARKYHAWNAVKPDEWTDFSLNTLREKIQCMKEGRKYYKTSFNYSFTKAVERLLL